MVRPRPAGAQTDTIAQLLGQIAGFDPFDLRDTEFTVAQLRDLGASIGISRIATTTLLDRIETPTAYCVRPCARHACAMYSSGKGFDAQQALISSVFECYERWAAERAAFTIRLSTDELLQFTARDDICVLEPETVDPLLTIDWALGRHLCSERIVAAPASFVEFPSLAPHSGPATTTGLAAHSRRAQATANAFFECVERHQTASLQQADLHRVRTSDLSGDAQALAARFEKEDIELHIFVIDAKSSVKTVYGYAYDHWLGLPQIQCSGFGACASLQSAADKALLECVQSRAAFISGLRADVADRLAVRGGGQEEARVQHAWLDRLRSVEKVFDDGRASRMNPGASLSQLLAAIATQEGLTPMIFPMRTRSSVPAVRVVVPELIDCS